MKQESNNIQRLVKIGILVALVGGFVAFTIHKIYIADPECYASKIELLRIEADTKRDVLSNRTLSQTNEKSIIRMEGSINNIEKNQGELKSQVANVQAMQNSIQVSQKEILTAIQGLK